MSTISSAHGFMMGFDKPQLRAKFKVASPSHCRNIIGEPQNFEQLPYLAQGHPAFSSGCDFMMGFSKLKLNIPNLKSLASAVAEILQGKLQISGRSSIAQGHTAF